MTDEQIIKALEICSGDNIYDCKDCPLNKLKKDANCITKLQNEALNIIKRQNAEYKTVVKGQSFLQTRFAEAYAANKILNNQIAEVSKMIRTKTIKEFEERLTSIISEKIDRSLDNPDGNNYYITDIYTDIDNLVKEMGVIK